MYVNIALKFQQIDVHPSNSRSAVNGVRGSNDNLSLADPGSLQIGICFKPWWIKGKIEVPMDV